MQSLLDNEILKNAKVGFEFEFYSNYSHETTAKELEKLLFKKVRIEDESHSEFQPSKFEYKIEPDMSGGAKLMELVTGALPYYEARMEFIKIMDWINKNGYTNSRCGLHLNVSFDEEVYGKAFISRINVLKFVLSFDEKLVYDTFPNRENNVYAKSVKFVIPNNRFYFNDITDIKWHSFITPNTKYYGINFLKLTKNYIEFRYLGGKDYQKRTSDVLMLLEHFLLETFRIASNPEFTSDDYNELRVILNKTKNIRRSFLSFSEFKKYNPDIGILIDLDSDDRRIAVYWNKFRDKLLDLLLFSGLKDGVINYDSDRSMLQIKDANLKEAFECEYLEFINCKVRGVLNNCNIFGSEVEASEIYNCNIIGNSKITGSKVMDSYTEEDSELYDCYVDGNLSLMNGKMFGGILRKGRISRLSKFDDKVEKVEFEKITI